MKRSNVGKIIEKIFNLKMFAILIIIAFLSAGYIYSFKIKGTTYEAKTTLLISEIASTENSNNRVFDEIISTYVEMTKSNSVIKEAIGRLKLENFNEENIKIERKNSSDFIEILVLDTDQNVATNLSNEIAKITLEKNIEQLNLADVEIIDSAENNCRAIYSNHATEMIAFAVMGCFVSLVSCQLIKTFDNKLKTKKDIESLDLKELIELPKIDKKINNTIIKLEDKSMFAEAFKIMRTNIQFINFKTKQKVIMVTEANVKKDLKSFIISNLAVGYANTGKKVMLIDGDIRNGNIANIFNIVQDFGLANYLSNIDLDGLEINENNVGKYIKNTSIKKLDIITAGYSAPNPSELIASTRFKDTLKLLEKVYDVVLVNVGTEDIFQVSEYIKSCIVIAEYNKMNKSLMTKIRNQFELKEGKIIGVILAKVPMYKLKYFNKYSIYLKSDEEELKNKKNIEMIEAKEVKEQKRKEKEEEKKFKSEVKQIEKEKAREVKKKRKEEKNLYKKEINEQSFIYKIYYIGNIICEFFENTFKKVKTRNKRLSEKSNENEAGIISESIIKEQEKYENDKIALENAINYNIQKDAIIQNLEKEIISKNDNTSDEEFLEKISEEYDNISEKYNDEITINVEKEKIKDDALNISKIRKIFGAMKKPKDKKDEVIEEIIENKEEIDVQENSEEQTVDIGNEIQKRNKFLAFLEKISNKKELIEEKIVEKNYKEEKTEIQEAVEDEETSDKELTYEEKYMNNYNELYNSEYSYSSTTSFADFERGASSKIDKSEKELLEQNEKLNLDIDTIKVNKDGLKFNEEKINEKELSDESNIDYEKIMREQALEEERILNSEKSDFAKFKQEQKEKRRQEKLEKKKMKKLEKESKTKLTSINYSDKKIEIDQEEEYLMENLYPKFK